MMTVCLVLLICAVPVHAESPAPAAQPAESKGAASEDAPDSALFSIASETPPDAQAPTPPPAAQSVAPPPPTQPSVPPPAPTEPPPLTDGVSLSAQASPNAFLAPGAVEVTLHASNASSASAAQALQFYGPDGAAIGGTFQLDAGGTHSYKHTLTLTDAQINAGGLEYCVAYVLGQGAPNEKRGEKRAWAEITRIAPQPAIEFSRALSASCVKEGGTVSVTYVLKNSGNVRLTGLVLQDELLGGTVKELKALDVGEQRAVTREVKVTRRLTSRPYVTYYYDGGTDQRSASRKASSVIVAYPELDAQIDVDKSNLASGDSATLLLKLSNTGNVPIYNLAITNDLFAEPEDIGTLRPGCTYVATRTLPLKSTTTFQMDITGVSADGSRMNVSTNELTAFVLPAASDVKLRLSARADRVVLDEPGEVHFELKLVNDGGLELRNVSVMETTRGEVRALLFVPPGEMPAFTAAYSIEEDGVYEFSASFVDLKGDSVVARADPIEITLRTPAPVEMVLSETALRKPSPPILVRRFWPIFWGACGLLAALVGIYIAGGMRARRARRAKRRECRRTRRQPHGVGRPT